MICEAANLGEALIPFLIYCMCGISFVAFCIGAWILWYHPKCLEAVMAGVVMVALITGMLALVTCESLGNAPFTESFVYNYDSKIEIVKFDETSDKLYVLSRDEGISYLSFFTMNDENGIIETVIPLSDIEIIRVNDPNEVGLYKYNVKSSKYYQNFNITCESISDPKYKLKILD